MNESYTLVDEKTLENIFPVEFMRSNPCNLEISLDRILREYSDIWEELAKK